MLFAAGCAASASYLVLLPDVRPLKGSNPRTSAYIERYKSRMRALGKSPEVRLGWTPLSGMSADLRHAVIISEDDMFYQHRGVDWESLREALRYDWKKGRLARGASTITQQLARNLYLSPSKNPLRKIKEMLIARRLERELSKNRILELYLNLVEWGPGIYGAGEASREYFGKPPSEIGPDEASALAAALPNPRRLNPSRPAGPRMVRRRETILKRMKKAGYL
jgi:monofunctional biosynthetic peptidoglycan transglycosylase